MATTIKQIKVYNGSAWQTANIGVNASDVTLSSNIAGSINLQTTLSNILPASQLPQNKVLISGPDKKISASNIDSRVFNAMLSGASTAHANFQTQIDATIKKTGNDTKNGQLTIKNNNLIIKDEDIDTTTFPSTFMSGRAINFRDKNDVVTGWVQEVQYQDGTIGTRMSAYDSVNHLQNAVTLGITSNQKKWVGLDLPAWKTALGTPNFMARCIDYGNITINAGSHGSPTHLDINIHDYAPAVNAHPYAAIVDLNNTQLPYVSDSTGLVGTWAQNITDYLLRITNIVGAWNNYHCYITIFYYLNN